MVMESSTAVFEPAVHTAVGPIPVQVEKADFNQDGNMDLAILSVGNSSAVAQEYGQSIHVLPGVGNGGFAVPYVVALAGVSDTRSRFAVGDYNGDGWADLALLEPSSSRIRLSMNLKAEDVPAFLEDLETITVLTGSRSLAAGDFTGDGKDDWIVGSASPEGGRLDLIALDGAGGTGSIAWVAVPCYPTTIAAARIDEDGALDIALGGASIAGPPKACAVLGDGAGHLGVPFEATLAGDPSEIAVGDLNADGLADLALTEPVPKLLSSSLVRRGAPKPVFLRGDANADGEVDISDGVSILLFLFLGGTVKCTEASDANDDSEVDISDPIYVLDFLFLGGPAPAAPFPSAGEDPGPHTLPCGSAP